MDVAELLDPVLTNGIRVANYFNGRVLTAEDLRAEQAASRAQLRLLGRAVGSGVAQGLEVALDSAAGAAPALSIAPGLAVTPAGDVVSLGVPLRLRLARSATAASAEAGLFAPCHPAEVSVGLTSPGLYVLLVQPAAGLSRERAPATGLKQGGVAGDCQSRYLQEGVRFRLADLDAGAAEGATGPGRQLAELHAAVVARQASIAGLAGSARTAAQLALGREISRLRNLAAHLCFGTDEAERFAETPFPGAGGGARWLAYGALDRMREQGRLAACEVPLALLYWTRRDVEFVDMWAVRRRLVPHPPAEDWPPLTGARRAAEAEAAFLQFQAHLAALERLSPRPDAIRARDYLRYLPSAGCVPLGTDLLRLATFFHGLDVERDALDPAQLRRVFHDAWFVEPIDLDAAEPPVLRLLEAPVGWRSRYIVFTREPRGAAPGAPPPPGPTPARTGGLDVEVSLVRLAALVEEERRGAERPGGRKAGEAHVLRVLDRGGALLERDDGNSQDVLRALLKELQLSVWAEDATGAKHVATPFVRKQVGGLLGARIEEVLVPEFRLRSLQPGRYTVHARAEGFLDASRTVDVREDVGRVRLELVPRRRSPGGLARPGRTAPGRWIEPRWYDRIGVIDHEVRWPWPPDRGWADVDPLWDPPPEVREWMHEWAGWLQSARPDAPIDPGGIGLVRNADVLPGEVADEPYAYLVFGEDGAYVPLVLVPTDVALDARVGIDRAAPPGIDARRDADRLAQHGLEDVDLLAAGWTGLVRDALGVSEGVAQSVIESSRDTARSLRGERQLEQMSGVDAEVAGALRAAGFNSLADVANSSTEALGRALAGRGVAGAAVARLLDDARRAVPGTWSLDAETLGLAEPERAALAELGVRTQGELRERAAEPPVRDVLGLSPEAAAGLAERIGAAHAEVAAGRVGEQPVTRVEGVDRAAAAGLARGGFATAGALAGADVEVLARSLGGDAQRAAQLQDAARRMLRR